MDQQTPPAGNLPCALAPLILEEQEQDPNPNQPPAPPEQEDSGEI